MRQTPEQRRIDQRREERQMMLNPAGWPRWPFLPVKRRSLEPGAWPTCGTILAEEGSRWTVYEGVSIYNLVPGKTLAEQTPPEKTHKYESVDELLDAGWVVD